MLYPLSYEGWSSEVTCASLVRDGLARRRRELLTDVVGTADVVVDSVVLVLEQADVGGGRRGTGVDVVVDVVVVGVVVVVVDEVVVVVVDVVVVDVVVVVGAGRRRRRPTASRTRSADTSTDSAMRRGACCGRCSTPSPPGCRRRHATAQGGRGRCCAAGRSRAGTAAPIEWSSTAPRGRWRRRSPARRPSTRSPRWQRPIGRRPSEAASGTRSSVVAGSALRPSAEATNRRRCGTRSCRRRRPRGTRARYIFVAECGPFQKPPSRDRFCSKVLPNRYVYSALLCMA